MQALLFGHDDDRLRIVTHDLFFSPFLFWHLRLAEDLFTILLCSGQRVLEMIKLLIQSLKGNKEVSPLSSARI